MGRTVRKGRATVTVHGLDTIEARARRLDEVAAAVITERLAVVHAGAVRGWPVETGRSRAGLTLDRTQAGAKITNDVDYSPFVRRSGEKRRAWDMFVRSRIAQARAKIAAYFGDALRRYLETGEAPRGRS